MVDVYTPKLALPLVQSAQAQKHITVNESLSIIDTYIQTAVKDIINSPPSSPTVGDTYIVKSNPTGDWTGFTNYLAKWNTAGWQLLTPIIGQRAYHVAEEALYIYDGTGWIEFSSGSSGASTDHGGLTGLVDDDHTQYGLLAGRAGGQTLIGGTGTTDDLIFQTTSGVGAAGADMRFLVGNDGGTEALTVSNNGSVGVGTTTPSAKLDVNGDMKGSVLGLGGAVADTTNKFSINTSNLLFNNGGGSIDATFNKNALGDDASFSFKTNFGAKAILGLLADNNFTIKVGGSFTTALVINEATGRISMPETPTFINKSSGRVYCNLDKRWVTNSDDVYGTSYYQFAESCGIGVDPVIEWEHIGDFLLKGTKIHKIHIVGRSSSMEVSDIEVYFFSRHPNPISRWETGMDSDTEDLVTDIHRDLFFIPTGGGTAFTGAMMDIHKRTLDVSFTMPEDGYVSMCIKPYGTMITTRYFYCTVVMECSMPAI